MCKVKRNNEVIYYLIYLSHGLSAWGDRMWDFAVGLYMVILYPDSLLLTAILGFATALTVIIFGSPLGSWIDSTQRIKSATISIIVQNLAVIFGASGLALMIAFRDDIQETWNGALEIVIFGGIILASIIAKLGSVASDIVVERDWIVILTDGNQKSLATMNAVMRTIDLTTKILAPVAMGSLISFWSQIAGAVFIAVWNIVSGIVEIYILLLIYKKMPRLSFKEISTSHERNAMKQCWTGWKIYVRHPVKWAGIGFSCLYMTVLGFDQITLGYMYKQGVGESLIGLITALGAITGIIGSMSYPFLRRCAGPKSTVIIGYFVNTICLSLCVISIFLPGSPFVPSSILSPFGTDATTGNESSLADHKALNLNELWEQRKNIFCFVAGIVFARFGLWIADLSITQILQDRVEESQRGVINGVQNAVNQIMDMFKFFLVILLPSTLTFGYLIIATWVFGCLGWILHFVYDIQSEDKENTTASISTTSTSCTTKSNLPDEQTPLLASK